MERFVAGEVVVIAFPYSDLKSYKSRPAIVLAQGDFGDIIVCQITSFKDKSQNTIPLSRQSFIKGSLPVSSYARPDKIFTADRKLVTKKVGKLNKNTLENIKHGLADLFGLMRQ